MYGVLALYFLFCANLKKAFYANMKKSSLLSIFSKAFKMTYVLSKYKCLRLCVQNVTNVYPLKFLSKTLVGGQFLDLGGFKLPIAGAGR